MTQEEYWRSEGLEQLVAESAAAVRSGSTASGASAVPFAPNVQDLVRLHSLARERMARTVLEFGVGFSTLVLADALARNEADFAKLPGPSDLRNADAFQLFSVDASEHWLGRARRGLPAYLARRVHLSFSRVLISTHNGQLCHFYERLPNVVPDFIYLDGPSPKDVEGSINGLDFSTAERTVMAADMLLMESTLLPRAFILVDGRTNNARFLARNFTRSFVCMHDQEGDVTTFDLDEPPLGRHSLDLAGRVRAACDA